MVKSNWPAMIILALFTVIGTLYAIYTPIWQVPDEPAHYNYIRSLAEEHRFPVMAPGDYDQAYLSRLTTERFPSELSVNSLAYEDHQPPLYYVLAVPVYILTGGSVVALRLFSLLLGGAAVVMAVLMLREGWPEQPGAVWLACGLVAFTPQFVAMMAAVNNDALILALLWLWLWLAQRFLRGRTSPWALGGVLGLILLTKATGYGVLVLAVVVVALKHRKSKQPVLRALRDLAFIFFPAILLGGVWWLRNVFVYGWPDFLGLIRHSEVVVGQPRTMAAISRDGLFPFLWAAVRTTFQSFWGQFGWMGVVLDSRIYRGLIVFTFCGVIGAIVHLIIRIKDGLMTWERDALILLGVSTAITGAMFVGYNVSFTQHQGRYLFPALPMFAMMMSLGLQRLLDRKMATIMTIVLMFFIIAVGVWGVLVGDIQLWWALLLGLAVVAIISGAFSPQSWHAVYAGGVVLIMALLDMVCLFGFIVPMLT